MVVVAARLGLNKAGSDALLSQSVIFFLLLLHSVICTLYAFFFYFILAIWKHSSSTWIIFSISTWNLSVSGSIFTLNSSL